MTLSFDFYFSFRSPYSYLALGLIEKMQQTYDAKANMRIVAPIALRVPGFFKRVNPLWPPYLLRDTYRISQYLGVPYGWPKPDPVVMDIASGEVPTDQPNIHRLMRTGILACERGDGFAFIKAVATCIWSGTVQNWHEGDHLQQAATTAGFDFATLEAEAVRDAIRIDEVITENEQQQKNAGHWGVPLFVFQGEPFFGQDRIDLLVWRMKQAGLMTR